MIQTSKSATLKSVINGLTLIAGLTLIGCNKPAVKNETPSNAGSSVKMESGSGSAESNATAKAILDACITKYKSLKSYQDFGVLTLRIPSSDSSDRKVMTEPMRIAFDAPNKLAIQAIDLQAMWSSSTWEAVVGKEAFKPFGTQRLVRPLPARIDLTWLIEDNLGATLDAPIIGSPIQLQLLFDKKPLAYLLEPDSKITLLKPEVFDSAKCERVQVISKELKWVFWIDQENQLLRKYEMPIQWIRFLVPDLPADFDQTKAELAIELVGAKADSSVDWSVWQIPRKPDELLVRRLVDAPPRNTPLLMGKELKPFDLRGADGKVILDSAQRTKWITVLCWVTNDELGESFVKVLIDIQRELDKRLPNQAEMVLVSQASASDMQESLKRWNCSLPLAIDTENLTQNVFSIRRQPAVVILDKLVRVQHFDDFGYLDLIANIVEDLHRGVDIASRRLQDAIHDEARFNSRLHRVIVEKSQTDKLTPIESFPFTDHASKEAWHVSFSDTIIAASGEHFQPQAGMPNDPVELFKDDANRQRIMTILDELGHVYSIDNTGKKNWIANIPIDQADQAKRIHVLPDPWTHRWIAIVPEGLPRFWLIAPAASLESEPLDATQYDLDQNESPVAFAWTVKDNVPSLAIATSLSKLRVLDPEAQKRFSADTGGIVSIVPSINDRGEVLGWNAIKTDGEILEIEDLRSRVSASIEELRTPQAKKLKFVPEACEWAWGRNRNQGMLLGMAQLPSGETGTILQSRFFEPKRLHPLSVRPEQCKIHSAATLPGGSLYWLSTAPNRVLHLQSADGFVTDQMSLGKRIISAGLFPDRNNIRVVLAVDTEVNCWSIEIPSTNATPGPAQGPAPGLREAISPSEQPSA